MNKKLLRARAERFASRMGFVDHEPAIAAWLAGFRAGEKYKLPVAAFLKLHRCPDCGKPTGQFSGRQFCYNINCSRGFVT